MKFNPACLLPAAAALCGCAQSSEGGQQTTETAGRGGGFILGSSSEELYETLPGENILAMWDTTMECGRHPI